MDDIQSWWEVPSIAHFCSLFRAAFNLLDFDIEDLEQALLTDGTEEDVPGALLPELIVRLLSGCLKSNDVSTHNYQMFLRRLFRKKCQEQDRYNPFNSDIDFQFLPLRCKVQALHTLCDFRLEAEDVLDLFKNLDAESLRVEPLGYDDNDSAYWYFYGTRLYREDFIKPTGKKKKKNKFEPEIVDTVWQVICFSAEDWAALAERFKTSTSRAEKALFRSLSENFLPEIPRLFQEKERLQRKRLLDWQPRRTSSRVQAKRETVEIRKTGPKHIDESTNKENIKRKKKDVAERRARALQRDRSRSNSTASFRSDKSGRMSPTVAQKNKNKITTGRQTNNSLASATGKILIEGSVSPPKKKAPETIVFSQTDEDLRTGMYKILENIKNHDDAWPFQEPVEEEYAPNYYSIIRRPMDLQRMEDKLDSGAYNRFSEFKGDFQLMVNNCRLYNGQDNEYTEMVDNLQEAFVRATDKFLDQNSSDEEQLIDYISSPPANTNSVGRRSKTKDKKDKSATKEKKKEKVKEEKTSRKTRHQSKSISPERVRKRKRSQSNSPERKKIRQSSSPEPVPAKKSKHKTNHKEIVKVKKNKHTVKEQSPVITSDSETDEPVVKNKRSSSHSSDGSLFSTPAKTRRKDVNNSLADTSLKTSNKNKKKSNKELSRKRSISPMDEKVMKKSDKDAEKTKKDKSNKKEAKKNNKYKNKKSEKYVFPERSVKSSQSSTRDNSQKGKVTEDDISSRSRSATPLLPMSDVTDDEGVNKVSNVKKVSESAFKHDTNLTKTKERKEKWREKSPIFGSKDKFDIIKERQRDKSKTDKNKQLFSDKNVKSNKVIISHLSEKEKNIMLQETIERLKAKTRYTDDILGEQRFDKLKKKTPVDEYEFTDDVDTSQDSSREKQVKGKPGNKTKKVKKGERNEEMDALNAELQGITEWLDDTPKQPDFSSDGNPPVIINDLEKTKSELDPSKVLKVDNINRPPFRKDIKEPIKRRPKDPLKTIPNRKREVQRTFDRLQPGKSKGNLISKTNMQGPNKPPDELFPLGSLAKAKEVKNALVVETTEAGPKLSLGSVLATEGFGIVQLHNFVDDKDKIEAKPKVVEELEEIVEEKPTPEVKEDVKPEEIIEEEEDKTILQKACQEKATPNLSAWFKAFGTPKGPQKKKADESEENSPVLKPIQPDTKETEEIKAVDKVPTPIDKTVESESPNRINIDSPMSQANPIPRTRKASTGSTISERSNFSQDMDSPRIGIDERLGTYPLPYPSPLHPSPVAHSPVMASPKPDEIQKNASYPNGTIKVGFYQDTTTKSSPEKSCSPQEQTASPQYPQYSHVYSAPNTSNPTANQFPYSGFAAYENASVPTYGQTNPPPYYDTSKVYDYKAPRSQDNSDYTSMSPNNSNKAFSQPNSPYNQPNSPYTQPNSPYTQPITSPFNTVNKPGGNLAAVPHGPNSPFSQSNQSSPYSNSDGNSPYSTPQSNSPYNAPQPNSPFAVQQQPNSPFAQPQQSPYSAPQPSPYSAPQPSPYSAPQPSPYSAPQPSPYSAPQPSPYTVPQPQPSPYSAPQSSPYTPQQNAPYPQQQQPQQPLQLNDKQQQNQAFNNTVANPIQDQVPGKTNNIFPVKKRGYNTEMQNMANNMTMSNVQPPQASPVQSVDLRNSGNLPQQTDIFGNRTLEIGLVSGRQINMGMVQPPSDQTQNNEQLISTNLQQNYLSRATGPELQNPDTLLNQIKSNQTEVECKANDYSEKTMNMGYVKPEAYQNIAASSAAPAPPQTNMVDMVNMGYPKEESPVRKEAQKVDMINMGYTNKAETQKEEEKKPVELVNMGYPKIDTPTSVQSSKPLDIVTSKPLELLGMGYGKSHLGMQIGKPMDISTTKAIDMFNMAASMGFPRPGMGLPPKPDLFNMNYAARQDFKPNETQAHKNDAFAYQRPPLIGIAAPGHQKPGDILNMNYQKPPANAPVAPSQNPPTKSVDMVNMGYPRQDLTKQYTAHTSASITSAADAVNVSKPIDASQIYSKNDTKMLNMIYQMSKPDATTSLDMKSVSDASVNHINVSRASSTQQHIDLMTYQSRGLMDMAMQSRADIRIPNPRAELESRIPQNAHMGINMNQAQNLHQRSELNSTPRSSYDIGLNIPRSTDNRTNTFNAAQQMMDPSLRNLANISQIMDRYGGDERLLQSLQSSGASYYDKNMVNAHAMRSANMHHVVSTAANLQQIFSQPSMSMAYNRDAANAYQRNQTELQAQSMQKQPTTVAVPEPKKRGRKKKNATPPVEAQPPAQQPQGFQSYAGVKPVVSEAPISLKTASVVPGSAFNFGPPPSALGLSAGLYGSGDKEFNYLDEFRVQANSYYLPHRSTPEQDKTARTTQQPQATPYQFLGAPTSRQTSFPFMAPTQAPQFDPTSPLYQQYLQRHQEELLRQSGALMMQNQGLLGPPTGYPAGYHHSLGMRQPFDPMNPRPSWL